METSQKKRDRYFGSHEVLRRDEVTKTSSDRSFGLVFAGFFALLGALGLWYGTGRWPIWVDLAVAMLVLALAAPKVLAPFNWVWTKFGLLLHAIVSPIILGIVFYVCITPIGFLMRLSGKDPLRLRHEPEAESYWIKRIIEPGFPAASLLYHAFACPDVHPTATGEPATSVDAYPTLAELDSIENYTYGLRSFQPADLKDVVVGVFAYEYRPRESTAHGYHADFVFSRTGIARVGTVNEVWDGQKRGFRGDPPGQSGIAVTPARYAAFLAEARQPLAADPIMGRRDERNDPHRTFLFPVHKLFSGKSCVAGATITLDFIEYHRNEKLKRIHSSGGMKVVKGFDTDKPPFVRDSKSSDDLVALRRVGASVPVVAQPHDQLVRKAEQKNSASRKQEPRLPVNVKSSKPGTLRSMASSRESSAARSPLVISRPCRLSRSCHPMPASRAQTVFISSILVIFRSPFSPPRQSR